MADIGQIAGLISQFKGGGGGGLQQAGAAMGIAGRAQQDIASYWAARETSKKLRDANKKATGLVNEGYDDAYGRINPYAEMGNAAYSQLQSDVLGGKYMGELQQFNYGESAPQYTDEQFRYTEDPAYKARVAAGMRGLAASAASRGSQLSGETMKSLQKYAGEEAANEYSAAYQRYMQNKQFNRGVYEADRGQWDRNRQFAYSEATNRYQMGANERQNQYSRMSELGRTGLNSAQTLANLDLGRSGTLANLAINRGDIDAGEWQSMGNAAVGQGIHVAEIGSGMMGGDSGGGMTLDALEKAKAQELRSRNDLVEDNGIRTT